MCEYHKKRSDRRSAPTFTAGFPNPEISTPVEPVHADAWYRERTLTFALFVAVASLLGVPERSVAQVSTLRCDGPDYGAECSLAEMIDDFGTFIYTVPNLKITVSYGAPALDLFNTDLTHVKVIPLEGFPGPGVRVEPDPGTWTIDGNGGVSSKSLYDISFLAGDQFTISSTDQVWYTIQTTTSYTTNTENMTCQGTYGGEGGWVDGTISVVGEFFANTFHPLGGVDFSAPSERVTFRNDQGVTVVEQVGKIDFGSNENIDTLRYLVPQVGFTATDCGTSVIDSAEIVAIEFRFVDSESLPPDADGDGYPDDQDAFPNDPSEWLDTDGDGIGNNADPDDDNDGVPDAQDDYPLGRFSDVQPNYWAFSFVEALARSAITVGCGGTTYCPEDSVTRGQMAVFLERGIHGSTYVPPQATGTLFSDVPSNGFAANYIEQLSLDGITAGCGNNNYCPSQSVTRRQMAVFLLRSKHGSGYTPPPATGKFGDVPLSDQFAPWIEQLAAEGITGGCHGGVDYCPNDAVTRAQMAVFLVRTFGLAP